MSPLTGGDLVCSCGWVLQAHCCEFQENLPSSRCQEDTSIFLTSSSIAQPSNKGRKRNFEHLSKTQKQLATKSLKCFNKGMRYKMEQANTEHLHLPTCVLDTAVEMYETVAKVEKPRGVNRDCLLPVCLYLACKAQARVSLLALALSHNKMIEHLHLQTGRSG